MVSHTVDPPYCIRFKYTKGQVVTFEKKIMRKNGRELGITLAKVIDFWGAGTLTRNINIGSIPPYSNIVRRYQRLIEIATYTSPR